ncbi:hypothetical protein ABPG74_011391 [Tetrahymena malaccensis]
MIMQNKKIIFEDMSPFERIINETKLQFFALMNYIVEANFISPFLYRIFIILEACQLAIFSIHPRLSFIWNNQVVQTIQSILKNIQFQGILDNGQGQVMESLVYFCFGINFFMFLVFIAAGIALRKKQKNKQVSGFVIYGLKLLSFFGILVKTVQPLPFFDIFLNVIVCQSSKFTDIQCYSGLYFIYVTLSVIGLLIQVFFSFIFNMTMIDMNPFSKLPFATPPNSMTEIKLLLKFILCLYFAIDYKAQLQLTLTILLTLYYVIFLVQTYNKLPYYDNITQKVQIVIDVLLFWISFCASVQAILIPNGNASANNVPAFYLLIGMPMVSMLYLNILKYRDNKYMQLYPDEIKKPDDMENYSLILVHLIENRHDRSCLIKLEGILRMHSEKCKESPDVCPCSLLIAKEVQINDEASHMEHNSHAKQQLEDQEKKWYLFLKSVISVILRKYNKCSQLHLLNAYLYHEKLKLKFKALTEMMTSEMFKPSIHEKFSMFRYKYLIELDIIETDMRNEQNKNVDVNGIVHFENQLVVFLKSIENSVNLHLEFWRELLEESPDIEKLQIVGSRITNTIEDAKTCFNNLCSIRQNNIRSLLIYGNFIKEVVNDEIESQVYLEKAAYVSKNTVVNKQFADNENMKYNENSNTGILTMSANLDTRFFVQNTNYDFTRILGWPKHEIVDQNIKNHIMPKLIQSIHDGLVSHYIESSIPRAIGIERIITPTNKDGFLVPSILMIKILPNLEEGLQFVGFFKEKDEIYCSPYARTDNNDDEVLHYLIYKLDNNLQNQTIVGITHSVYENFGIPTSLINNNSPMSNQFTIDLIMPQILDPKTQEDIQTEQGAQITLDTTIIEQLFLISQESEEEEVKIKELRDPLKDEEDGVEDQSMGQSDYEKHQLNKKYKKCEINLWLEEEFTYKDTTIHILKFVELQGEGTSRNEEGLDQNILQQTQTKQIEIDQQVIDPNNHNEDEQNMENNQENENEEAAGHSSISQTSQDYEELRQLKDIKQAISEKTKPKTIKILQRSVVLIVIFLFILTSVDLAYKFKEYDMLQEAMNAIYYSYNRHSTMADINYSTRKIWFLSNSYITAPSSSTTNAYGTALQSTLGTQVQNLNSIQFNTQQAQMNIEQRKGSSMDSVVVNTQKLLPNGQITEQQANFTDSLNVYMAQAGGLANTTLSDFQDSLSTPTSVTTTKSNFFSVNYNGIYPLRNGSEYIAQTYFDFYYKQINNYQSIFLAIMILAIIILTTSQFILLPIVFSVQKTNAIVLSFFAIVPMEEINKFAKRCEKFLKIFIERKQDVDTEESNQDNKSVFGGQTEEQKQIEDVNGEITKIPGVYIIANENNNQNQSILNQNQNPNNMSILNQSQNPNMSLNQSYNLYNPQEQGLISAVNHQQSKFAQNQQSFNPSYANTQRVFNNQIGNSTVQRQILEKQKEEEDKKNEDEENQRMKILNAKDHKKKFVILQFTLLTSLLMLYFILVYAALEINFQQNIQSLLQHTQYTRQRPSLLKYYFDFIQEGLVNLTPILSDPKTASSQTLQNMYTNLIQTNDNVITSSFKNSFPSQFSSYYTDFENINYGSVCQYTKYTVSSDQQLNCKNIPALQNGLSRVVTQIGVDGNSILASTLSYTSGDKVAFSQAILQGSTYQEIENLMVFVSPTIDQLNNEFQQQYQSYLDFKNMLDKLCYSLFIVFVCIIFIFIWIPYLGALIKRIWMTKGVLNMIPIDIILKHEKLRQAFTAGDILSAVK